MQPIRFQPIRVQPIRVRPASSLPHGVRRGTALLVVLVVITLLSLAAYTFSELMVVESRATRQYSRDAQARELANSAIDYVAAQLGNPVIDIGDQPNYYHNPALFGAINVVTSDAVEGQGWFSIIASSEHDSSSQTVRFGLMNESARLNLNTILNYELDAETQRFMLTALPNMTDEIADAILDWIDTDTDPRESGCEFDYYQSLAPPYDPADGELESIDDLLKVRGVTPALLYGEDANRNGILDPNENDGEASLPLDNADGVLDVGWSVYLTTNSSESNLRPDESAKIDVNQSLLTELYDQIADEYDEDLATFITAYRLFGATNVEPLETTTLADNSTGDVDTDAALQNLATSMARQITGGAEQGSVTRGGLDLSQGATTDIESLFELLGAEVAATVNGQPATLSSPLSADSESLKLLLENFATDSSSTINGRINVNEAREATLLTIPWMTTDLAAGIIASRPTVGGDIAVDDLMAQRTNTGWILLEGLADVTKMRELDAFVTTGGDVYRVQAVGRFTGPGPSCRVEAIIDASDDLPKITFRRDLTELGSGYRLDQLQPTTNSQ
ncbi:MAG: hypothetical protein ACK5Q5_12910 [Planctomycetaceae bacterium]